jgi:hypothetical protein
MVHVYCEPHSCTYASSMVVCSVSSGRAVEWRADCVERGAFSARNYHFLQNVGLTPWLVA